MVSSDAATVEEYLAELPADRREMIAEVRNVILANLPEGYEECMNWGMISYEVPLDICPDTYNGQPLSFCGLASQKRNCALYMMPVYQDPDKHARLLKAYEEMGRKPNMGKSCIRFTKTEYLPLDLIAEFIADSPMDEYIEHCKQARS